MSRSLSFKIYAIVSSVLLLLTSVLAAAPPALANQANVVFDEPKLDNFSGQEPLRKYDRFGITWTWNAPTGVTSGEHFTVQVDSANVQVESAQFPLLTDNQENAGSCVAENNTITCTFNELLQGRNNVGGFVKITGKAAAEQDSLELPVIFNGTRKVITLPDGGTGKGIIGRVLESPKALEKGGWQEGGTADVHWEIKFPGSALAGHENETLVIEDKLSSKGATPKFTLGEAIFTRQYGNSAEDLIPPNEMRDSRFEFDGNTTIDSAAGTITITPPSGGFKADKNYVIWYKSHAAANVNDGDEVENTATMRAIPNQAKSASVNLATASAGGNGNLPQQPPAPTNGTFKVKKKTVEVGADGSYSDLALTKAFQVHYTCTKDGQNVGTGDLTVTSNGEAVDGPQIPQGAECVLTEPTNKTDGSPNWEQAAGYAFNSHHLQVENAGSGTHLELNLTIDGNVPTVLVTNKYTPKPNPVGKFKIIKKVVDNDNAVAADKEYSFKWTCTPGAGGGDAKNGTATITGEGEWVSEDIPAGYSCAVSEDEVTGLPANVTFAKDVSAAVTIQDGATQAVNVTNTFAKDVGKFTLTKKVVAPAGVVPAGKKFTFNYVCTDPKDAAKNVSGTLEVGQDESAESKEIPAGYNCAITETNNDVDGATVTVSGLQNITIVKGDKNSVTATNTYTQLVGAVKLNKKLAGSASESNEAKNKTFKVGYVCTKGDDKVKEGTGEVSVAKPLVIENLPVGTECAFTEDVKDAKVEGLKFVEAKSTIKATTAAVKADGTVEASVTNHYDLLGSVKVNKKIAGSAADLDVAKNKKFKVAYVCKQGEEVTKEGNVEVSANEPATISDVPVNSVCAFTEDTAGAEIEGLTFMADASTVSAQAPAVESSKTAEATLVNNYDELGSLQVTKEVTGRAAGSSDNSTEREYEILASWTANGKSEQAEFKLKSGETYNGFPKLPVGTVVTLKEKLPNGDAFTSWSTPGYSSETAGAVVDNGDGTATVTVQKGTFEKATLVKVTNTANIPWYWFIVPFVPLIPFLPKPPNPPTTTPPTPGQCIPVVPGQPTPPNPNNLPPCGCIPVVPGQPTPPNPDNLPPCGCVPGKPNVPAKPGEPSVPCGCIPVTPGQPTPANPNNLPLCDCVPQNANGNGAGHGNGAQKGIPCVPAKGTPKGTPAKGAAAQAPAKQGGRLANTGASVIGLTAVALLTLAAGAVFVARSRRES